MMLSSSENLSKLFRPVQKQMNVKKNIRNYLEEHNKLKEINTANCIMLTQHSTAVLTNTYSQYVFYIVEHILAYNILFYNIVNMYPGIFMLLQQATNKSLTFLTTTLWFIVMRT